LTISPAKKFCDHYTLFNLPVVNFISKDVRLLEKHIQINTTRKSNLEGILQFSQYSV
jgi:hypothetical protein